MKQYWMGTVTSVSEYGDAPEVALVIDTWVTLDLSTDRAVTDPYPPPPLPRRRQVFYLVDEETFRKVSGDLR